MGSFLETPRSAKRVTDGDHLHSTGIRVKFGTSTMQGWRNYNEDTLSVLSRHFKLTGVIIFSVFDGHGGDQTSKYLQTHFNEFLFERISLNSYNITQPLVTQAFLDFDKSLPRENSVDHIESGSTGTVCIINAFMGKLVVAHVGDSRAVVFNPKSRQILHTTRDHSPCDPIETRRIITRSRQTVRQGRVWCKERFSLNVCRCFGDRNFKSFPRLKPADQPVVCVPDYYEVPITLPVGGTSSTSQSQSSGAETDFKPLCVFLASDGIWNASFPSQIITPSRATARSQNQHPNTNAQSSAKLATDTASASSASPSPPPSSRPDSVSNSASASAGVEETPFASAVLSSKQNFQQGYQVVRRLPIARQILRWSVFHSLANARSHNLPLSSSISIAFDHLVAKRKNAKGQGQGLGLVIPGIGAGSVNSNETGVSIGTGSADGVMRDVSFKGSTDNMTAILVVISFQSLQNHSAHTTSPGTKRRGSSDGSDQVNQRSGRGNTYGGSGAADNSKGTTNVLTHGRRLSGSFTHASTHTGAHVNKIQHQNGSVNKNGRQRPDHRHLQRSQSHRHIMNSVTTPISLLSSTFLSPSLSSSSTSPQRSATPASRDVPHQAFVHQQQRPQQQYQNVSYTEPASASAPAHALPTPTPSRSPSTRAILHSSIQRNKYAAETGSAVNRKYSQQLIHTLSRPHAHVPAQNYLLRSSSCSRLPSSSVSPASSYSRSSFRSLSPQTSTLPPAQHLHPYPYIYAKLEQPTQTDSIGHSVAPTTPVRKQREESIHRYLSQNTPHQHSPYANPMHLPGDALGGKVGKGGEFKQQSAYPPDASVQVNGSAGVDAGVGMAGRISGSPLRIKTLTSKSKHNGKGKLKSMSSSFSLTRSASSSGLAHSLSSSLGLGARTKNASPPKQHSDARITSGQKNSRQRNLPSHSSMPPSSSTSCPSSLLQRRESHPHKHSPSQRTLVSGTRAHTPMSSALSLASPQSRAQSHVNTLSTPSSSSSPSLPRSSPLRASPLKRPILLLPQKRDGLKLKPKRVIGSRSASSSAVSASFSPSLSLSQDSVGRSPLANSPTRHSLARRSASPAPSSASAFGVKPLSVSLGKPAPAVSQSPVSSSPLSCNTYRSPSQLPYNQQFRSPSVSSLLSLSSSSVPPLSSQAKFNLPFSPTCSASPSLSSSSFSSSSSPSSLSLSLSSVLGARSPTLKDSKKRYPSKVTFNVFNANKSTL